MLLRLSSCNSNFRWKKKGFLRKFNFLKRASAANKNTYWENIKSIEVITSKKNKEVESNLEKALDSVVSETKPTKTIAKRNSAAKQFELSTKQCGSRRSCYVSPRTCDTEHNKCEYVLSWEFDGELINYQLTAISKNWAGVVFSKDKNFVRLFFLNTFLILYFLLFFFKFLFKE